MSDYQAIKDCYGSRLSGKLDKCGKCKYSTECKKGKNPGLMANSFANWDDIKHAEEYANPLPREKEIFQPRERYSHEQMMEIVAFVVSLDEMARDIIKEKIRNPDIQFSDIAYKRGITRQAIHQFVQRRCKEFPGFEAILFNRKRKIENARKITFMEAVCKIRRQTQEQRSKKQEQRLKSSRSSNFWKTSLSLLKRSTKAEKAI